MPLALLAWLLAGSLIASQSVADSWSIVQIEEDWELVVNTPDSAINSPQVTSCMSPVGNDDGDYMTFELNHQSQPDYETGGLHVHAWDGAYVRGTAHVQCEVPLQTSNETITWTQSMSVSNGLVTYEVKNGQSSTWGAFGTGDLRVVVSTDLDDLSRYRMQQSVTGSGVGYGANRVQSYTLKRVRFITQSGQVFEFNVNYDIVSPDSEA